MADKQKILNTIYDAIDEVNLSLPQEKKVVKSEDTVLFGVNEQIDSLGLTMLIVAIEQKVEEAFGTVITLVDGSTMSNENSPFQSIRALVEYIDALIERN
ncbi:MAG: acyl carrier protein [Candidatus Omnitrophica bacterium]|nr:acyl carrier protein [Candidatus Omnitrophota bacterium]MCB9747474.1 acyl carrier protein [Candidatus Omnitrophota bacterium]